MDWEKAKISTRVEAVHGVCLNILYALDNNKIMMGDPHPCPRLSQSPNISFNRVRINQSTSAKLLDHRYGQSKT